MNAASDQAFLCNIAPDKWPPRHRTYFGSVEIAAPAPGQPYALTRIAGRNGSIDLGDRRTSEFPITARAIAEDLAREVNSDSGEGSFHGVFVCAGEKPTEQELVEARSKLEAFYRKLVAAADLEWERSHSPLFITDLDRRAARVLGLDKPWLYDPRQQMECPLCAEKLKPGVAVCKSCGAILDREKAKDYLFVTATLPAVPTSPQHTPAPSSKRP
jgi:hypothetical protein